MMHVARMGTAAAQGGEYIGRGGKGSKASALANPRRLDSPDGQGGTWQRGETVDLFERDLRAALDRSTPEAFWWDGYRHQMRRLSDDERQAMRDEMNRLLKLARAGDLTLVCFCAPARCHGDAIAKILTEKLG